jgi:putative hydrolase of the HAD superfamily
LILYEEIDHIEDTVGKLYFEGCGAGTQELARLIQSKTWVGFDLDDTLHDFRKASGAAMQAIYSLVLEKFDGISISGLQTSYKQILARNTSSAFSDGRTSDQYRAQRFIALLDAHSCAHGVEFIEVLLEAYKERLLNSLQLGVSSFSVFIHIIEYLR